EPGVATPPADPGGRVRERRSFFRSRYHAEDRRDVGAAVARAPPYRPRARGRVRIRGPALSVADRDRRADHRGTLVGPAVLWPDQAGACIRVAAAANEKPGSRNAAKRDQRSDPPHDQLGERPDLIGTGVAFSSSNTTSAARLGTISGPRSVLPEPGPNSKTIQSLSRPHHRRCGTGISPDRDITARRHDVAAPRASLPTAPLAPARNTRGYRGFST